jgi:hypothetical protein
MQKFPIKSLKTPKSYHIAKFANEVDFSNMRAPKIRQKTIEDETIEEEEVTDTTKKASKQDGHVATLDRQYFGDRRGETSERKTWILDDPSLTSIRYEGNGLKESENTCYYIFIKKGKDFIALPVEETWTYFKPIIKKKVQSTEEVEEFMNQQKNKMNNFFEKLSQKVPGFEGEKLESSIPKKKNKKVKKEEDSFFDGGFSDDEEFVQDDENISEPEDEKEEDDNEKLKKQIKKEDSSDDESKKTKKRKLEPQEMPVEKKKKVEVVQPSDSNDLKNQIVEYLTTRKKVTLKSILKIFVKEKKFEQEKIKEVIGQVAKLVTETDGQKFVVLK